MHTPDLVDALGGRWTWVACYVDDDGNLRSREDLDADSELGPVTEDPQEARE